MHDGTEEMLFGPKTNNHMTHIKVMLLEGKKKNNQLMGLKFLSFHKRQFLHYLGKQKFVLIQKKKIMNGFRVVLMHLIYYIEHIYWRIQIPELMNLKSNIDIQI